MGHIWAKKSVLGHFSLQCEVSLVQDVHELILECLDDEVQPAVHQHECVEQMSEIMFNHVTCV